MTRVSLLLFMLSVAIIYFLSFKRPSPHNYNTSQWVRTKSIEKKYPSVIKYKIKENNNHQKEFKLDKILSTLFNELPRKNQIQYLSSEELHHTPDIILIAGKRLGDLRELLSHSKNDPTITAKTFQFYKKCAFNKDLLKSIRTLCFIHAKEIDHNIDVPNEIKLLISMSKL